MASTFSTNVPAFGGHLPPQSVNAAATGAPGTGGYVKGDKLLGARLLAVAQTGAFTGAVTNCVFKLSVATDANGGSVADVTGGAIVDITAAGTQAQAQLPSSLIDPTKYYGIRCAVTAGTSALVSAQLLVLDPVYAA